MKDRWRAGIKKQKSSESRQERNRKRRRWYYTKQRFAGIILLTLTVPAVMLTEGDATIALITVPLGLSLVFTKKMLIVNDFYREMKQ